MNLYTNMSEILFSFTFQQNSVTSLLNNAMLSTGFSVLIHLILILGLTVACVCILLTPKNETNQQSKHKSVKTLHYKLVLCTSTALSIYSLVLCLLSYIFWRENDWSGQNSATLVDLLIRALAWFLVSVYLYYSKNSNFPFLLKFWWWVYLAVSTYCSVIDMSQCVEKRHFPVQVLASDAVYVVTGLFFCCSSVFEKETRDHSGLKERLLNGKTENETERSLYENAGFLSQLSFYWVGSLITKGYNKILDLNDVPPVSGEDDVNVSYKIFRNFLDVQRKGNKTAEHPGLDGKEKVTTIQLAKSLIFTTWAEMLISALYCLLHTLSSYVGPYLIDTFVQYLNGKREFKNEALFLVSAFCCAKIVECIAHRHWFFRLQVIGIRVKAVLSDSIYKKTLTLSCQSKQGQTSGEMINFMSVDAERVGNFSWYIHDPWMLVLQISLALVILYKSLGIASVASLVTTVMIMLLNFPLSTVMEKYQEKLMKSKDQRMKATSEILKNMRILKLQAWEMKFLSKISELRKVENGWLKIYLYTLSLTTFLFYISPTLVSVITFGTCTIVGVPLESGKILTALATFRILQEPIYSLPETISIIIQTKVSLDRIASFLSLDDLDPNSVEKIPSDISKVAIEISGGNFSWGPSDESPNLKDINLTVGHGTRVAICGTVGSGKSTLLSCILGEVPKISGILRLSGSTAYVPQSPWIQSGKIVDNILFGREMDALKYDSVLEACALKKDLEILSFGDQTVIGERGINLSGGQKQRVQIARALYQDADIYVFDDPFSAVDAHTGSHLFKECLLRFLKSKTVIYVTHQVEFLPAADQILVMKDGRIMQAGKYKDILSAGTDFVELVGAHEHALSSLSPLECSVTKQIPLEVEINDKLDDNDTDDVKPVKGQLVEEEEREKGRVGLSVYWKYVTTAYGGALVPFILLSQIFFQLLQIVSNYWMAWATPASSDVKPVVSSTTLILVYVALSVGSAVCVLARATLLVTAAYKTATLLFSKMHACIFRAPMSFFDATPSGRILNRASTDQSAVDMNIANQVGAFVFSLIQLIGIIGVMSQVAWQVFLIFIPVTAISIWYQQYYLPSARELSRLAGVAKAPVIQHFSETIAGAATIRSFNQESRFCETSLDLINGYSRPKFYNAVAILWLCFRLDLLCVLTFACSLIFLVSIPVGLINPGIAGLAVTYGLNLSTIQGWVIWNLCSMENKIIAVERILQYTCITSEPPLVIDENRPHSSWPSRGEINIHDLKVRYAPHMPLVLQGITCTFGGGKKTGIVGRTGSGKSTLIQTLFRLLEPVAGRIIIDGINISTIGLHDLRSRLSIIPQDPTMFEGTIRTNLDPLEEYNDDQIWEALEKCQLAEEVRRKDGKLDSLVTENGENWSMGQRQLVCLGRVLLKRSKVLVLDEATASVDTATDNLMQQTLRQHFCDSTVIVIAHRITSVIHSDLVVLLSNGLVLELDSPSRLLENKSSSFSKLVAEYANRSNSRAAMTGSY